ncbi:hypothetical protein ZOSMA_7G01810 [Zostera marina]|uniref:Uncharacterized protein n=1 Tax=Zostera marina TaxID=29655 RepID=A0A0K9NN09_ZOSMR|nr:hypothetical protein ZOSMA_7G01810 [Zostera marina]
MDKKARIVCAVCGFLAVVSASLAFAAEGTKIKPSDLTILQDGSCIYPSKPTAGLGLLSQLFLVISFMIINVVSGCFCCKTHQITDGKTRTLALSSFVLSWVLFVFTFFMLLAASSVSNLNRYNYYSDYCYTVKSGFFAGSGVMVLATIASGLVCYVLLSKSKNLEISGYPQQQNQGISMGQPQFTPQSYPPGHMGQPQYPPQNFQPQQNQGSASINSDPVFVHEDTYRRQQFP